MADSFAVSSIAVQFNGDPWIFREHGGGIRFAILPYELLALPEFDALRQFLEQRGVEMAALQAEIDRLVETVRQQV